MCVWLSVSLNSKIGNDYSWAKEKKKNIYVIHSVGFVFIKFARLPTKTFIMEWSGIENEKLT